MPTNDFLTFCPTDTGTNLVEQSTYLVTTGRTLGQQPGIASSALNNKALRQSAAVVSQFAQAMSDRLGVDVLDDGISANMLANINALFASFLPAGCTIPFAGTTAPSLFLLCYGQEVSRTTYSALFLAIGTTYGSGDGSTTFNLPDLRGRTVAGLDNMGGTTAGRVTNSESGITGTTLGASGGSQSVAINTSQMPSHTHVQDAHTHTQDAHNHTQDAHTHSQNAHSHGITDPGHSHSITFFNGNGNTGTNPYGSISVGSFVYGTQTAVTNISVNSSTATNNVTTATNQVATATNQSTVATNQSTGSGGTHQNMQPSMIMNWIIKT